MNFLQLCQRLAREAGINLTGPTSTAGNSGTEFQRVVDWVNSAYADIQRMHDDWLFMKASFSLTTSASDGDYTATEVVNGGATLAAYERDTLRCYLQSAGQAAEQHLYWRRYQSFMDTHRMGAARTAEGFPQFFAVAPDKGLLLAPLPDAVYVVTGDYQRAVDELSGDSDTPIFDADYHMAIVWQALITYAGFEETASAYVHAQNMLNPILGRMERLERPEVGWGAPLA
jgi:hypothetical protein